MNETGFSPASHLLVKEGQLSSTMIKFFRKIRLQLMAENKFSRYLLYALGEIVLVVIGILIAIQINNANQAKKDNKAIEGHLLSIAQNIEGDLKRAEYIKKKRNRQLTNTSFIYNNLLPRIINPPVGRPLFGKLNFTKDDVVFSSRTLREAFDRNYLNPNTSGFESLTNSGYLEALQGTDIGNLLSEYYNALNELVIKESSYNEWNESNQIQFANDNAQMASIFFNPDFFDWSKANDDSREELRRLLQHQSVLTTLYVPYELIVGYENLMVQGKELVRLIKKGEKRFDDESKNNLVKVFYPFDSTGYSKLLINGYLSDYYSTLEAYSAPVNRNFAETMHESIRLNFPPMDWAVSFFYVGKGSVEQLETRDFSMYRALRLELKGAKGGEQIQISIKDETNPTDGSEAKVPLTLTDEWKIYEIPLSRFEGTNLKKLFMPAAVIFEKEAAVVSARNIEYIY